MFIRYHQHLLVMDMTVFFCILSFYQQTLHRHQFTRCMAACPQCMRLPYLFQFYYHTLVQFKCMLCSVQCTIYYWKGHKGHILPYALMHTKRWLYWNAFSKGKWSERERERLWWGKGKKERNERREWKEKEKSFYLLQILFFVQYKFIWLFDIEQCDKQCIDCTTFALFVIITIMTVNGSARSLRGCWLWTHLFDRFEW